MSCARITYVLLNATRVRRVTCIDALCLINVSCHSMHTRYNDPLATSARVCCTSFKLRPVRQPPRPDPLCPPIRNLPHAEVDRRQHLVCVHACMCVCMYVCMYRYVVCMYVCMHACMHRMSVCVYACMYACMYVCACIYVCMYVCMYVCLYVFMYVYMHACMYVCTVLCLHRPELALTHGRTHFLPTWPAYIHTYIYTSYMHHKYIHAYIHT